MQNLENVLVFRVLAGRWKILQAEPSEPDAGMQFTAKQFKDVRMTIIHQDQA